MFLSTSLCYSENVPVKIKVIGCNGDSFYEWSQQTIGARQVAIDGGFQNCNFYKGSAFTISHDGNSCYIMLFDPNLGLAACKGSCLKSEVSFNRSDFDKVPLVRVVVPADYLNWQQKTPITQRLCVVNAKTCIFWKVPRPSQSHLSTATCQMLSCGKNIFYLDRDMNVAPQPFDTNIFKTINVSPISTGIQKYNLTPPPPIRKLNTIIYEPESTAEKTTYIRVPYGTYKIFYEQSNHINRDGYGYSFFKHYSEMPNIIFTGTRYDFIGVPTTIEDLKSHLFVDKDVKYFFHHKIANLKIADFNNVLVQYHYLGYIQIRSPQRFFFVNWRLGQAGYFWQQPLNYDPVKYEALVPEGATWIITCSQGQFGDQQSEHLFDFQPMSKAQDIGDWGTEWIAARIRGTSKKYFQTKHTIWGRVLKLLALLLLCWLLVKYRVWLLQRIGLIYSSTNRPSF